MTTPYEHTIETLELLVQHLKDEDVHRHMELIPLLERSYEVVKLHKDIIDQPIDTSLSMNEEPTTSYGWIEPPDDLWPGRFTNMTDYDRNAWVEWCTTHDWCWRLGVSEGFGNLHIDGPELVAFRDTDELLKWAGY